MALSLDGLYYMVQDASNVFQLPFRVTIFLHTIRFLIRLIISVEISSIAAFVVLSFISFLLMVKHVLKILLQETKIMTNCVTSKYIGVRIEYLLRTHIRLQIAMKKFALFQELGTLALMLMGLLVFVFANFATLRFYRFLPFAVFTFFPSISAMVGLVVNLTLPYTHEIFENSIEFGRILRVSMGNGEVKYFKRKISSVRAVRWYAGINGNNIFCLNRETKVQYFQNVVNYTITLLLGVRL